MSKKKRSKAQYHIAKSPKFVCEQYGAPEREFKNLVGPLLEGNPLVERGYLARVRYESSASDVVALCLRLKGPSPTLLREIGKLFASMFGRDQHLDILCIDQVQEKELSDVCTAFFESHLMVRADFYMASSESYAMENPRRCLRIKRLKGEARDDYLLIGIAPPLIGQAYGLGGLDVDKVVIATRYRGDSLFPIQRWPVFVHVARLLVPYLGQGHVGSDELELIAWAELYQTEAAARDKGM